MINKVEIHKKLNEYRLKKQRALETMQQYYHHRDSSTTQHLNAAVYDNLNESKRINKDFMEKLSSGWPTPTNRNSSSFRDLSLSNSQKKVRYDFYYKVD